MLSWVLVCYFYLSQVTLLVILVILSLFLLSLHSCWECGFVDRWLSVHWKCCHIKLYWKSGFHLSLCYQIPLSWSWCFSPFIVAPLSFAVTSDLSWPVISFLYLVRITERLIVYFPFTCTLLFHKMIKLIKLVDRCLLVWFLFSFRLLLISVRLLELPYLHFYHSLCDFYWKFWFS